MRTHHRTCVALTALAFLSACAQAPVQVHGNDGDAAEVDAVLATMDRYLAAISAKDHATMRSLDMPNSMTWSARPDASGAMVVGPRPSAYWSDPANDKGSALQERYWNPTVFLRGPIAVVWAPYEFKIDGKTSHCGVDVFDFVKVDGAWRLANAMWTVEPKVCDGLRPTRGAAIRP
ncbi:MAG: hypothetical protein IT483_01660 [Gammaproteobacteria bacterium]|nr:hypothetical protein [Gammaproteobacteria bacterium]